MANIEQKTEIRIRPATSEDATNLAAMSITVWVNTYAKDGIRNSYSTYLFNEFTRFNFKEIIGRDHQHLWVAENKNSLVGYLQLSTASPCPKQTYCKTEIERLYILDRYARAHIGSRLLEKSLEFCREANTSNIWLSTNIENNPAIKFYANSGFDIVGTIMFELEDGQHPNHVFMREI